MNDADLLFAALIGPKGEAVRAEAVIAGELGWDADRIEAALVGLPDLVTRWPEAEGGPALMLSDFAAEAEGLRLVAEGEIWKWRPIGVTERREKLRRSEIEVREIDLTGGQKGEPKTRIDHMRDPGALTPDGLIAMAEDRLARLRALIEEEGPRRAKRKAGPPLPVLLFGSTVGHMRWDEPFGCQDCGPWQRSCIDSEWRQSVPAYCLRCLWYSHAHLLPKATVLPKDPTPEEKERVEKERPRKRAACVKDKLGYTAA